MTFNEAIDLLEKAIRMPASFLVNPEKRIFVFYLLSAFLLAGVVFYQQKKKSSFLSFIFNQKVWFGASARVDYYFLFFNAFVKLFAIAPMAVLFLYLPVVVNDFCTTWLGHHQWQFSATTILVSYTIAVFLVKDFMAFFIHYLFHKVPFLWNFHKVHHAATVLNPITQYRIHPVELIINNLNAFLVTGVITGVFNYLYGGQLGVLEVIGVNAFRYVFLYVGSNLRHSHVKLRFPSFVERIFISPVQHQIHHGVDEEYHDKNMGSVLAIWDALFGTLVLSKSSKSIKYGLTRFERDHYKTFYQNLVSPFLDFFRSKKS